MKKDRFFIGLGIWVVIFIFGLFKYVSLTYPSLEGVIKSFPSYIYFILSSGFVFGLVLLVDAFTDTKRWGQTPRNLLILSMVFICVALYLVPLIFNESGFITLGIIFFILMPASLLFLFIRDVERGKINSLLFILRAEELIQVQYLGALLRNDSCSCSNTSSALLRGTFIASVGYYKNKNLI